MPLRFVLVLALGLADPAVAAPILDQSSWPPTAEVWTDANSWTDQSFTVGRTGQLVAIDVWVLHAPAEGATLQLSFPNMGDVGVSGLIPGGPTGLVAIDLTPFGFQVVAGDLMQFKFNLVGDSDLLGLGATDGVYAAGDATWTCGLALSCINPAGPGEPLLRPGTLPLAPLDIAFRTYVSVPEPTTHALFALGLGALAALRRSPD
ncbi:MAG: PEP-CTERM sorting domain-containing protein [bacterium]|nr:PEP-CTERM sorting domain-containing protein [bacterium]